MKKESKISVVHFEKKNLEKRTLGEKAIYPIYIRVTYQRRHVDFRSRAFDELWISDLTYSDNLLSDIKKKDIEIVAEIVKKVKDDFREFSLSNFKKYYIIYSYNVRKTLNVYFIDSAIEEVQRKFPLLSEVINRVKDSISINDLMMIAREVDAEGDLYNEIDRKVDFKYSFMNYFIHSLYDSDYVFQIDANNISHDFKEELLSDESARFRFIDSYIPLIHWVNGKEKVELEAIRVTYTIVGVLTQDQLSSILGGFEKGPKGYLNSIEKFKSFHKSIASAG